MFTASRGDERDGQLGECAAGGERLLRRDHACKCACVHARGAHAPSGASVYCTTIFLARTGRTTDLDQYDGARIDERKDGCDLVEHVVARLDLDGDAVVRRVAHVHGHLAVDAGDELRHVRVDYRCGHVC